MGVKFVMTPTHPVKGKRKPKPPTAEELRGWTGAKGDPGDDGAPGRAGKDGKPGRDGRAGFNGMDGADGNDGRSIFQGEGPPPESLGANGNSYINSKTGDLYEKDGGDWEKTGNIRGPKGPKGERGLTGAHGVGSRGPRGFTGPAGSGGGDLATIWVGNEDPPPGGVVGQTILVGDVDPVNDE